MDPAPFEAKYSDRTPRSADLAAEASTYLPGGDTRSVTYHRPYPSFVAEASGCTMTTIDDETLLDFLNNYTQSVLATHRSPSSRRFAPGSRMATASRPRRGPSWTWRGA